jgi:predicted nucleic acid-binding protein
MKMYAIDTNLLIYTHNIDSPLHESAKNFIEKVMNERDQNGELSVCIPAQVFVEFISVVTSKKVPKPLSINQGKDIVQDYLNAGAKIIVPQTTYLQNFLELLAKITSRKQIFDVAIATILKDNLISGIYTVNVDDFKDFDFLEVINPLASDSHN